MNTLEPSPVTLDSLLEEAYRHFAAEDWPRAREGLLQAVRLAPQQAQLHGALALVQFKLNAPADALASVSRALELAPNRTDLLCQLAIVHKSLGHASDAEAALRKALAVQPGDVTAGKLLADHLSDHDRHLEAIGVYQALIDQHPDQTSVFLALTLCCLRLSEWTHAHACCHHVLAIDPDNTTAREHLAELRTHLGPDADIPPSPEAFADEAAGEPDPAPMDVALDPGLTLEIGAYSYVHDKRLLNPSGAATHVVIGKFCSIATDLTIIGYDHATHWITTYPFLDPGVRPQWSGTDSVPNPSAPALGGNIDRGDIRIGNDVWIGYGVKLFKGVTIGDGAVIGACSLVTKDVPPYTVVVGSPAKVLRTRFTEAERDLLLRIRWWDWPRSRINAALPYLCSGKFAELEAFLRDEPAPLAPTASTGGHHAARAVIEEFIEGARSVFKDVEPPTLPDRHLRNSRLVTDRNTLVALLPKGGVCAEVGTQTGHFAKYLLNTLEPLRLDLYDLDFTPFDRPHFEPAIASGRVTLHAGDSATLLARVPVRTYDFIYIDGDHAYEGVSRDLAQAVRVLKDDGWIVCNDYTVYSPLEKMNYGVARAVNEFCIHHDFEIIYLGLQKWGYHDVALRRIAPEAAPASPVPTEKLHQLAKFVGDDWKDRPYYDEAEAFMDQQWRDTIWPLIRHADFSEVIDLAAGHGRNSEKLKQHARRIHIVDINQENIDFCRRRFAGDARFSFLRNDGCSLQPLADASISFVYCFDAMVHFDSDIARAYLAEFRRVMKPGALGFCHHSNFTGRPGGDVHDTPGWRNFMSQSLFAHYCAKEGLRVVKSQVIDWEFPQSDCVTLFTRA